jgi:hypothetical protein
MNKKFYFVNLNNVFNDGGNARNRAFLKYFEYNNYLIINVYNKFLLIRLYKFLFFICVSIFTRSNLIFIHYGTLVTLFPYKIYNIQLCRNFINFLLKKISINHNLSIEINDLPFEQSIDLDLKIHKASKIFQENILSLKNCSFIFASNEMKTYSCNKYGTKVNESKVIINGAFKLQSKRLYSNTILNIDKFKFIYAGSLNQGRQIEDLIKIFENKNVLLLLIGEMGEWLQNYPTANNIIYLGSFPENIALEIVSLCNIGLIPYNEDKFYYNISYPTKSSFYIASGIPILSTPLKELSNVLSDLDVAYFVSFKYWDQFISNLDYDNYKIKKENIIKYQSLFYWEYLLNDL